MRRLFLLLLTLTALSALFGFAASLPVDGGVIQVFHIPVSFEVPGTDGTSLAALKSAEGYREQNGDTGVFGVRGDICVTNGGEWTTRGLQVVDTVQVKAGSGPFVDYVSQLVDLGDRPVLAAGETACYPYEIQFTPVDGAKYRNLALATITNHAGWMPGDRNCPGPDPCPFGPEAKVNFVLPKPAEAGEGGAGSARALGPTPTLAPTIGAPTDGAPTDEGKAAPVTGAEPSATPTPGEATGVAETATPTAPTNWTATPTPTITGQPTPTDLPTPTLAPTEALETAGCTYSAGHWAWDPQSWPVDEIEFGGQVYSQEDALEILLAPAGEDDSYPLAQQLIAALLNVENGAVAVDIEQAIQAAGEWFELHPLGSSLSNQEKNEADALAQELGDFNDGLSGPPQCEDEDSRPSPTSAPTATTETTPTWTATPTLTAVSPGETATPAFTPTPTETSSPSPSPSETPPLPPAGDEALPTETPLPTDTPEPASSEEPGAGEGTPGG